LRITNHTQTMHCNNDGKPTGQMYTANKQSSGSHNGDAIQNGDAILGHRTWADWQRSACGQWQKITAGGDKSNL